MKKYFRDTFVQFKEESLKADDNIFNIILEERKNGIDSKRFFLEYLPEEIAKTYDFNDPQSLRKFRNANLGVNRPLMNMGGCNLNPEYLEKDKKNGTLRYAGIKMSDPYGRVLGSFDIRDGIITYSPIFPHFYDERDLCKFANDTYYTTMTFEDIMLIQIDEAHEYFVHIGDSYKIGRSSSYVLQKVNKDQMIQFVNNPEDGEKVYRKVLNNRK